MKKFLVCVLTCILACSLVACGTKKGSDKGTAGPDSDSEYTFVAKYCDLDLGENTDLYRAQIIGDKLYYTSYDFDEATSTYTNVFHVYSLKENQETEQFSLIAPEEQQNCSMQSYIVLENGEIVAFMASYDEQQESSYELRKYDKQHQKIAKEMVKKADLTEEDYLYVSKILVDGEGRCYLIGDDIVGLYDAQLKFRGKADTNGNWIAASGIGKDKCIYAAMYDQASNQQVVRKIDFEKCAFGETYGNFVNGNSNSMTSGFMGDFLVSDGIKLYDYKMADESRTELLTWLDCDIFGDYVQEISCNQEGEIYVILSDWSSGETQIVTLQRVKRDELKEKETITIGMLYQNQDILSAIVAFNKQSDAYHIDVKYYLDTNDYSESAYENARTRMNQDIVSENCPDLVDALQMNVMQLASKNAFEDLNTWLAQSKVVSAKNFNEKVLENASYNGALIYIPKTFTVETVVAKASGVGEEPGWRVGELIEYAKAYPEAQIFQGATKESMLYWCMDYNQDAFIDYASGKCHFDSEEFQELLAFIASFPEKYEWSDDDESIPTLLQNNQVLLEQVYLTQFQDVQLYPAMFNEPVTYIGYPTTDGSVGTTINPNNGLAMMSKSKHKEAAWEFLEFYLGRDNNMFSYGFPTNKAQMQEMVDKALTVEYVKDENGELVLDEEGKPIPQDQYGGVGYGDWEYQFRDCTKEDIDTVYSIISNAKAAAAMDSEVLRIITEESEGYFAGQKKVEDVAKVIQSRVQVYLNENQ